MLCAHCTICNIRLKIRQKIMECIIRNNVCLFLWGFKVQTKVLHGFGNLVISLWKSVVKIAEGFCTNPGYVQGFGSRPKSPSFYHQEDL